MQHNKQQNQQCKDTNVLHISTRMPVEVVKAMFFGRDSSSQNVMSSYAIQMVTTTSWLGGQHSKINLDLHSSNSMHLLDFKKPLSVLDEKILLEVCWCSSPICNGKRHHVGSTDGLQQFVNFEVVALNSDDDIMEDNIIFLKLDEHRKIQISTEQFEAESRFTSSPSSTYMLQHSW